MDVREHYKIPSKVVFIRGNIFIKNKIQKEILDIGCYYEENEFDKIYRTAGASGMNAWHGTHQRRPSGPGSEYVEWPHTSRTDRARSRSASSAAHFRTCSSPGWPV